VSQGGRPDGGRAPEHRGSSRPERSFGGGVVFVERLVTGARHVEVLQLRPGGEASFDASNPLNADLIVVDETSMVGAAGHARREHDAVTGASLHGPVRYLDFDPVPESTQPAIRSRGSHPAR
jgi:hypothetical protein